MEANKEVVIKIKVLRDSQASEEVVQLSDLGKDIRTIRMEICRICGLPETESSRVRLIYKGQVLKDGTSLADAKFDVEHSIHAVIRPSNINHVNSGSSSQSESTQTNHETPNLDEIVGNAINQFVNLASAGNRPQVARCNHRMTMITGQSGGGQQTPSGILRTIGTGFSCSQCGNFFTGSAMHCQVCHIYLCSTCYRSSQGDSSNQQFQPAGGSTSSNGASTQFIGNSSSASNNGGNNFRFAAFPGQNSVVEVAVGDLSALNRPLEGITSILSNLGIRFGQNSSQQSSANINTRTNISQSQGLTREGPEHIGERIDGRPDDLSQNPSQSSNDFVNGNNGSINQQSASNGNEEHLNATAKVDQEFYSSEGARQENEFGQRKEKIHSKHYVPNKPIDAKSENDRLEVQEASPERVEDEGFQRKAKPNTNEKAGSDFNSAFCDILEKLSSGFTNLQQVSMFTRRISNLEGDQTSFSPQLMQFHSQILQLNPALLKASILNKDLLGEKINMNAVDHLPSEVIAFNQRLASVLRNVSRLADLTADLLEKSNEQHAQDASSQPISNGSTPVVSDRNSNANTFEVLQPKDGSNSATDNTDKQNLSKEQQSTSKEADARDEKSEGNDGACLNLNCESEVD